MDEEKIEEQKYKFFDNIFEKYGVTKFQLFNNYFCGGEISYNAKNNTYVSKDFYHPNFTKKQIRSYLSQIDSFEFTCPCKKELTVNNGILFDIQTLEYIPVGNNCCKKFIYQVKKPIRKCDNCLTKEIGKDNKTGLCRKCNKIKIIR